MGRNAPVPLSSLTLHAIGAEEVHCPRRRLEGVSGVVLLANGEGAPRFSLTRFLRDRGRWFQGAFHKRFEPGGIMLAPTERRVVTLGYAFV